MTLLIEPSALLGDSRTDFSLVTLSGFIVRDGEALPI